MAGGSLAAIAASEQKAPMAAHKKHNRERRVEDRSILRQTHAFLGDSPRSENMDLSPSAAKVPQLP